MLVYIRESDKDNIICNVDEKDIAEHLRVDFLLLYVLLLFVHVYVRLTWSIVFQVRLKKEQEEKEDKRRYKAQAHLYTIIKVFLSHFLFFP